MSDFKSRQLSLMMHKISSFRRGILDLNRLIQQLEGLARAVGDDFWNDYIFNIVADLEGINSELIDKDRKATFFELEEIDRLIRSLEDTLQNES